MTKFIISAARPAECRSPVPAKAVRRPCRVRRSDRGHEHFGDADPVDEAFRRHATTPKSVAHVPIFADIAVDAGLVFQNRHQALLCVLLFDEILSLSSDDGAPQEHLEPPGQRVELHRILGPEHLDRNAQARANIGPRISRLHQHLSSVCVLEHERRARVVLRGAGALVDFGAHQRLQFRDILRSRPFQASDRRAKQAGRHLPIMSRHLHRSGELKRSRRSGST